MRFQSVGLRLLFCWAQVALLLSVQVAAHAQECPTCGTSGTSGCASCGESCQSHHCPPPFKHCMLGPPCVCVKYGCPLPVCNPCNLEHWGYYQPCWRMWPFPPDWSHCPYPTPASLVAPPPPGLTMQPAPAPVDSGTLPLPRRLGVQPGL